MISRLERYRELLDIKKSVPDDVNASLDRFLIAKYFIAHYSLTENLRNAAPTDRKKRIQEIEQAKQLMYDELAYLKFQEDMLDKEMEQLIALFTGK